MTITLRRAAINLAEAIRVYDQNDYETSMNRIVDAIDALPLPFRFRASVYDGLITAEGEAETDAQQFMVEAVQISFQVHRSIAEARGEEPFAPEFDAERFAAHALGTHGNERFAYNKAHGITGESTGDE